MLKEFWKGRYQLNIDVTLQGNLLTKLWEMLVYVLYMYVLIKRG